MLENLKAGVENIGKDSWTSLLKYTAILHEQAIKAPFFNIQYVWEEIAPGQFEGGFLGGWDSLHIALDVLYFNPQHAKDQVMNILNLQTKEGLVPGYITIDQNHAKYSQHVTSPPLWPIVLHEYLEYTGDLSIIAKGYIHLKEQIQWFETNRKAPGGGFYYLDITDKLCESGMEGAVRFSPSHEVKDKLACIDASCHVLGLYDYAWKWSSFLGRGVKEWEEKSEALTYFIVENLYCSQEGWFFDQWWMEQENKPIGSEGLWALLTGVASHKIAKRILTDKLMTEAYFLSPHPCISLINTDSSFDGLHWRGGARNSMAMWMARACVKYGYHQMGQDFLERALDCTAIHFEETGTLWEYYLASGESPLEMFRYPNFQKKEPIHNHLGHNPLIAMALMWERLEKLGDA